MHLSICFMTYYKTGTFNHWLTSLIGSNKVNQTTCVSFYMGVWWNMHSVTKFNSRLVSLLSLCKKKKFKQKYPYQSIPISKLFLFVSSFGCVCSWLFLQISVCSDLWFSVCSCSKFSATVLTKPHNYWELRMSKGSFTQEMRLCLKTTRWTAAEWNRN